LSNLDSTDWLQAQLDKVGLNSISKLAETTGINKGTLSKYFRGIQRPSIDVIEPLCTALKVSPETLLKAMKALDSN
jgi:transcriptional regulator with XRE-family HTH domain